MDDIEKKLYPSHWTKRFVTPESCLEYIEKFFSAETQKNAQYLKEENVRYGKEPRQLLDIYYKDTVNEKPILLFVHGGYWQEFCKESAAFWIKPYVEKGYCVIIAGYDLCPNVSLKELVAEIQTAITFTLQFASEKNSSSLAIVGHSAGAHLVISSLVDDVWKLPNSGIIKALFLVAGIYDLRMLRNTSVNENNLLSLDDQNVVQLSPVLADYTHLKNKKLNIYVLSAEYDSPLFIEQAEIMDKHLKKFEITSILKHLNGVDHFDVMENLALDDFELSQLLFKELEN